MRAKPVPKDPERRSPTRTRIGAALWIVAAVQFLAAQLVVGAAWRTPYSRQRNNISDLGNVSCRIWDDSRPRYVCSPLHDLMNASFVAHGALLAAGVLLTGAAWGRGGAALTGRTLLVLTGAAWVVVGLTPADVDENLHVLAALVILVIGNAALICAGLLPRHSRLGSLRPLTLAVAVLALAAAVMFFGGSDPGIGRGTLERLACFGADIWMPVAALAVLRARTRPASPRAAAGLPAHRPPLTARADRDPAPPK
ncbi:DUF998 domain-containing protein [Streptomyces sp. NPDC048650]|uniref:DUF998 domain-containing protein n=1 Tax=unclassified Streptomyces TaxID=2593676 RepID=UPI00371C5514